MPFDPKPPTVRSIKLDFDDAAISPRSITIDGFADFIGTAKVADVVLAYPLEAPLVQQYIPVEEALSDEAIASLVHQPIVNSHPRDASGRRVFVDPRNASTHTRGVVKRAWREGTKLRVELRVYCGQLLADIMAGKVDLSTGADCDTIAEIGTAPDGSPYQAVQRRHRYNHIAVEYNGRNPGARLTADGQDGMEEILALIESGNLSPEDHMKLAEALAKKGVVLPVAPKLDAAAAGAGGGDLTALTAMVTTLTERVEKLETATKAVKADGAEVTISEATMNKLAAQVAAKATKGIRSLTEARDLARPILGVKADGIDDVAAIHRDAVIAVFPEQKTEVEADYAAGRTDSLARSAALARSTFNRKVTADSADDLDRTRSTAPKSREDREKGLADALDPSKKGSN